MDSDFDAYAMYEKYYQNERKDFDVDKQQIELVEITQRRAAGDLNEAEYTFLKSILLDPSTGENVRREQSVRRWGRIRNLGYRLFVAFFLVWAISVSINESSFLATTTEKIFSLIVVIVFFLVLALIFFSGLGGWLGNRLFLLLRKIFPSSKFVYDKPQIFIEVLLLIGGMCLIFFLYINGMKS